jgi:PAS domain S-box-containing protein
MDRSEHERGDAQAELARALREASDFKQALDEHAIVAITDAAGIITCVNGKFCEISGYAESELIGQDHRILNSGQHPASFFRDLWNTIKGGAVWRGEIRNRRRDGTMYWVDTTIVPFLDGRKTPHQYIAIRTDITERKNNEERFKEMACELDRKNRELQSAIHTVSHDLRSPLVNIHGFASMLGEHLEGLRGLLEKAADGSPPASGAFDEICKEMERALGFLQAGATRMDGLLGGMLSVSRLGNAPLTIQDLDLNDVVEENLAAMKFQIMEANAEFVAPDLPMVRGDGELLGRVLTNLFENALKFASPERPLVLEISGERSGTTASIRVSDNGMGMAGDCQHRIFDLFYRVNANSSGGHGIGLAIAKAALERMQGSISVSSEIGKGSVFTLTLPSCAR